MSHVDSVGHTSTGRLYVSWHERRRTAWAGSVLCRPFSPTILTGAANQTSRQPLASRSTNRHQAQYAALLLPLQPKVHPSLLTSGDASRSSWGPFGALRVGLARLIPRVSGGHILPRYNLQYDHPATPILERLMSIGEPPRAGPGRGGGSGFTGIFEIVAAGKPGVVG
jgi:hypothetical protein